jgi:FkbM family methyltransferase
MSVARALAAWWVTADETSRRNLLSPAPSEPLPVRIRALAGEEIWIRPGTSDRMVVMDTFLKRLHLPPRGADVRTILDLGANTGLTARDLAYRYPRADLLCVEMDPENAELARRNLAPIEDRARVIEAAAWTCTGTVRYSLSAGAEWAARVESDGERRALAMSLEDITRGIARIDYVKMDVEGTEAELLGAPGEWIQKVRDIKVEVHEPYSIDRCIADLRRAGFDARPFSYRYRLVVGRNRRKA